MGERVSAQSCRIDITMTVALALGPATWITATDTGSLGTEMSRIFMILLLVTGLAACETAKGVGRDLEKAGTTVTGAAKSVQKKL